MNYVNEDAFFAWYKAAAKRESLAGPALLADVVSQMNITGRQEYILPPSETKSGREERYSYRFENIGCCGASTMYIYF